MTCLDHVLSSEPESVERIILIFRPLIGGGRGREGREGTGQEERERGGEIEREEGRGSRMIEGEKERRREKEQARERERERERFTSCLYSYSGCVKSD